MATANITEGHAMHNSFSKSTAIIPPSNMQILKKKLDKPFLVFAKLR